MFVSRKELESRIALLERQIERLRQDHDARLMDIERQFATKYNDEGKVVETLADVPITERANVKVLRRPKSPLAGMSWRQRQEWLERTEGGRKLG